MSFYKYLENFNKQLVSGPNPNPPNPPNFSSPFTFSSTVGDLPSYLEEERKRKEEERQQKENEEKITYLFTDLLHFLNFNTYLVSKQFKDFLKFAFKKYSVEELERQINELKNLFQEEKERRLKEEININMKYKLLVFSGMPLEYLNEFNEEMEKRNEEIFFKKLRENELYKTLENQVFNVHNNITFRY